MSGQDITKLRKSLGQSRAEFAARLGTTYESVCRWENDNRKPSKRFFDLMTRLERDDDPDRPRGWVFWSKSLARAKQTVQTAKHPVFGTLWAAHDPFNRLFVTSIRLHGKVKQVHELASVVGPNTEVGISPPLHHVGVFLGGEGISRIPEDLFSWMRQFGRGGPCAALIFDRTNGAVRLCRLRGTEAMWQRHAKGSISEFTQDVATELISFSTIG